jgi:hypothetical protein
MSHQYEAHHYKVTDESITPTGKTERHVAETISEAVEHCLYYHRLHEGYTHCLPGSQQIIVCPKHGQIAVVRSWLYEYLVNDILPLDNL